jgi:hypothetical protein
VPVSTLPPAGSCQYAWKQRLPSALRRGAGELLAQIGRVHRESWGAAHLLGPQVVDDVADRESGPDATTRDRASGALLASLEAAHH